MYIINKFNLLVIKSKSKINYYNKMNNAYLEIIFCSYNNNPNFDEIQLNGVKYPTKQNLKLTIAFNKYEEDLGKKVCEYVLFSAKVDFEVKGSFEIFSGLNVGFCYLDDVGTTFEIMFLQKMGEIENFLKSNYTSLIHKTFISNNEIKLSLNRNETKDRANLILINCLEKTKIKKDGKIFIDLKKAISKIENYDSDNSYKICFHYNDYENFSYQIIEEEEELNFEKEYKEHYQKVEEVYSILIEVIKKNDINIITKFIDIFDENEDDLKSVIVKKYSYGKKILEEELNNEYYVDFIFKILFFIIINERIKKNREEFSVEVLKDIYKRLLENKSYICNDKDLKIYEKIFLLMDIYLTDVLLEDDYKIHYFHKNKIEKGSPLDLAFNFLNEFIEELDYDSYLYYPLISIDGGNFYYKYKKNENKNSINIISIFGFNMLSLEKTKEHLKNMIPNVILSSKYLSENLEAISNPTNGNTIINISKFKDIKIDKKELNENQRKHNAFILSKTLIHELFGHKKSSYSKKGTNFNSIISFKNENGDLKFISQNDKNNNIFKDPENIDENVENFKGDSGYFIEFFLGDINGKYTFSVIDTIQNEMDLSALLNAKLWHKEVPIFKEYVKLKTIFVKLCKGDNIDDKLDIYKQINFMKSKIEDVVKNEDTKVSKLIINTIDKRFDDSLKEFIKQRKQIKIDEKQTENKEKESIRDLNKTVFKGFTHGFYRK